MQGSLQVCIPTTQFMQVIAVPVRPYAHSTWTGIWCAFERGPLTLRYTTERVVFERHWHSEERALSRGPFKTQSYQTRAARATPTSSNLLSHDLACYLPWLPYPGRCCRKRLRLDLAPLSSVAHGFHTK